ncbi:MAG: DUF2225 domain-containing protein [Gammaproteobacteria bacterium]|nr:DUF2225 domain-containing protein [Gammaproteobacteria bacterium]
MAVAKDAVNSGIIALIKVGADTGKMAITELSMQGCSSLTKLPLTKSQPVILHLLQEKANGKYGAYQPISAVVQSATRDKTNIYQVTLSFKGAIAANQGVAQILEKKQGAIARDKQGHAHSALGMIETSLEVTHPSLYVIPMRCHLCDQEHIPFISLQSRTMESKMNIFGVPQYRNALPGKEFCDYNLLRITVCPKCFFASGETSDFIREKEKSATEPFSKEVIVEHWLNSIAERQTLIGTNSIGFFSENRSVEQALISYDLAVLSSNALLTIQEQKHERTRNYEVARKGVASMLIKAELLMSNKKPKEAQLILKNALKRLLEIFPFLTKESSIKAAFLMGMLGLYFENGKIAGENLNFLRQYEQNNRIRFNSEEQKTLNTSRKMLEDAYQNRADFSFRALKGFDKPY